MTSLHSSRSRSRGRTVVAHGSTNMTTVQNVGNRLTVGIRGVDRPRDMVELNIASSTPLLYSEVLNINMAGTGSGAILVDDPDGSLVVNIEAGRARLGVAKIGQDHAEAADHFGSKDSGKKLSFSAGGGNGRLELTLVSNGPASKINEDTADRTTGEKIRTMCSVQVSMEAVIIGEGGKIF